MNPISKKILALGLKMLGISLAFIVALFYRDIMIHIGLKKMTDEYRAEAKAMRDGRAKNNKFDI